MKARVLIRMVFALLIACLIVPSANAGSLSRAKDFLEMRMYSQAIAFLQSEINQNPANAEAHFLLGKTLLETGNAWAARESLDRALIKRPARRNEVGKLFFKEGERRIAQSRLNEAKDLYELALQYDPRFGPQVTRDYFISGKSSLDYGRYELAEEAFSLAISRDNNLRAEICDLYYRIYRERKQGKVNNREAISFLKTAKSYCASGHHSNEINKLLEKFEDRSLGEGKYHLTLENHEQTGWLGIRGGTNYYVYLPDEELGGGFILQYDDGTIVDFTKGGTKPLPRKTLARFKIISHETGPQNFTITVKPQ